MKEILFVTATNTDVGKSYSCEKLLEKFSKEGKRVGYLKPFETGVVDDKPIDGTHLLNVAKKLNKDFDVSIDDVVPFQFELPAAPFVASGGKTLDLEVIKDKIEYLLGFCDTLIVEGAGGLMVPINKDYFIIDLIKELGCEAILIAPSNLGSINDTLLSQKALQSYGIKYDWYINLYRDKDSFQKVTMPFYKEYFKEIKFI